MTRITTSKILLLLLILALFATACSKDESKIQVEDFHRPGEKVSTDQPKEKPSVSLPSAPPSSAFQVPEKNGNGTFRVRGLIHNQEKYIDKEDEINITGIISYISPQCDPKKAKEEGRTCLKPNLFIKDDVDSPKSLQIVGFPFEFVKKNKIEPGQTHVYTVKYLRKSNGFINSGDGLLKLIAIDEIPVDPRAKR